VLSMVGVEAVGDVTQPEPSRLHRKCFPGYRPGREHFLSRQNRSGTGADMPPEASVWVPGAEDRVEWKVRVDMTKVAAKDPHHARTRALS